MAARRRLEYNYRTAGNTNIYLTDGQVLGREVYCIEFLASKEHLRLD